MANLKTGISRKQSTPKFPKNKHSLPPDTHTYVCVSGGKKCLYFGNFGVLCFLETPVLRFTLLPYYQRLFEAKNLNLGANLSELSHSSKDWVKIASLRRKSHVKA